MGISLCVRLENSSIHINYGGLNISSCLLISALRVTIVISFPIISPLKGETRKNWKKTCYFIR